MTSLYDSQAEAVIFEALLPELEAQGYRVLLSPATSALPEFMRGFRPDAIALKGDRKIAIEVAGRRPPGDAKLARLQSIFAAHPEWELRVLFAPPLTSGSVSIASQDAVMAILAKLPQLMKETGSLPALLTGWSAFEAAARSLVPATLERPQSPKRLIEVLSFEGFVTPEEADLLRRLGRLRDLAAHGGLDVTVTEADLSELARLTEGLLIFSRQQEAAPSP